MKIVLNRPEWRMWVRLRQQAEMRGLYTHFLYNRNWRPMTREGFAAFLKRNIKKVEGCGDKNVGVSLLRCICITHALRGGMSLAKRRELANTMGHNTAQQSQYRKML